MSNSNNKYKTLVSNTMLISLGTFGSKLLGHIVFRDSPHKSIALAGEHRLLRETGFHSQQAHIAHIELER